jgi:hypothetical protein
MPMPMPMTQDLTNFQNNKIKLQKGQSNLKQSLTSSIRGSSPAFPQKATDSSGKIRSMQIENSKPSSVPPS